LNRNTETSDEAQLNFKGCILFYDEISHIPQHGLVIFLVKLQRTYLRSLILK